MLSVRYTNHQNVRVCVHITLIRITLIIERNKTFKKLYCANININIVCALFFYIHSHNVYLDAHSSLPWWWTMMAISIYLFDMIYDWAPSTKMLLTVNRKAGISMWDFDKAQYNSSDSNSGRIFWESEKEMCSIWTFKEHHHIKHLKISIFFRCVLN